MMALSILSRGEALLEVVGHLLGVGNWTGSTSSSAFGSMGSGLALDGRDDQRRRPLLRLPYSSSASCSSCGV